MHAMQQQKWEAMQLVLTRRRCAPHSGLNQLPWPAISLMQRIASLLSKKLMILRWQRSVALAADDVLWHQLLLVTCPQVAVHTEHTYAKQKMMQLAEGTDSGFWRAERRRSLLAGVTLTVTLSHSLTLSLSHSLTLSLSHSLTLSLL